MCKPACIHHPTVNTTHAQPCSARDAHLLDAADTAILSALRSLPRPAAALALRLLVRKRVWQPLSSLDFPEVPDAAAAAAQLVEHGLVQWDDSVTRAAELRSLLETVPADVLRTALLALLPGRHPALSGGGGKAALVTAAQVPPLSCCMGSVLRRLWCLRFVPSVS